MQQLFKSRLISGSTNLSRLLEVRLGIDCTCRTTVKTNAGKLYCKPCHKKEFNPRGHEVHSFGATGQGAFLTIYGSELGWNSM